LLSPEALPSRADLPEGAQRLRCGVRSLLRMRARRPECRLLSLPHAVDFAAKWLAAHRT